MHSRAYSEREGDFPSARRPRLWLAFRVVPVVVALLVLLAAVPSAGAGGRNAPILVTTGDVVQSESSGTPIQVDPGSWLLFRTGQVVADGSAEHLDDITIEIELDGEALAVEMVTEDFGQACGDETCADATVLWGYASSPPLTGGTVHTLTYRQIAAADGEDGLGGQWTAGVIFESTGTLVAGARPPTDPFVGGWLTTDSDGSQWAFFIEAAVDDVYRVEGYDHGGSICGDPGSRTPGASIQPPEEPVRWGGFGMLDPERNLVFSNSGFYCLDPVLGPYQVMRSDVEPEFDPDTDDDGPVTGTETISYDPDTDTLTHDEDPVVLVRIKETDVESLRKRLAKGG